MRISDWSSDVCSSDLLEPDRLRLPHQPVDLLKVLGDRLELREIDPAQVLGLVDQHCRFVLERLDLVVDLLERARGGEQILAVVAWIAPRKLRVRRCARHGPAHYESAGRAGAERGCAQTCPTGDTNSTSPLLGV